MKRAELMALHDAATPGVGHDDHEARWEEFANAVWWCLPGIMQQIDDLKAELRAVRGETVES